MQKSSAPKTQLDSPPPSPGYNPANDHDDPIEPPTPKDEVISKGTSGVPPAEETAKSVTESLHAVAEAAKEPETPAKKSRKKVLIRCEYCSRLALMSITLAHDAFEVYLSDNISSDFP